MGVVVVVVVAVVGIPKVCLSFIHLRIPASVGHCVLCGARSVLSSLRCDATLLSTQQCGDVPHPLVTWVSCHPLYTNFILDI